MGTYKLLLDADTQTDRGVQPSQSSEQSMPSVDLVGLKQQLVELQVDFASRINEIEMKTDDIQDMLNSISKQLSEFKQKWEHRTNQEKDSDLLMRNVGLLS